MARIAVVDPELCNPSKCQLECIRDCPVNRTKKPCIELDESTKSIAIISEELCTGCGICPKVCPFHAITIVNTVAPVEEKLIYRYGQNLFSLYGVALAKPGIFAVVGENGCGKSTNLKLITGQLTPQNLYTKEVKSYFDNADYSSIATKPQELSSKIKGVVGQLLKSVDECGRLNELSKVLDLENLYQREFEQLSGGELQRVVIAAVLLRNKKTFIMDEPLAFLDYTYRIRLSNYLKEKFSDKQVLVVDHDLSLLSHFCESAYIVYGTPGAYGVVSQPYAVDRAINMFLDGFIQPENVRFRNSINYQNYIEQKKSDVSFILPAMEFKKGDFTFSNPSSINLFKGEVIGIAGPNGTGKSSFCNELAKEFSVICSLKPQLLSRSQFLAGSIIYPARESTWADNYLRQMSLLSLEFRPLDSISYGELQKLRILESLIVPNASLFLLDEPTTALDAPARIKLSKLLREKAESSSSTIIIVDHDLEFLYNTVDRLIIFEGNPSVNGKISGIYPKLTGISNLLSDFDLSYRLDSASKRLKLNKQGSVKDRKLKESGEFIQRE